MAVSRRALLGFVAAALSVLTFHQGMWAVLHALGMVPLAPYPMTPVPPLAAAASDMLPRLKHDVG